MRVNKVLTGLSSLGFALSLLLIRTVGADATINITENLGISESISILNSFLIGINENFKLAESIVVTFTTNGISITTTTITSIITIIGIGTCNGSSCFTPPNADVLTTFATTILFPALMIIITALGFMYIGGRFFSIIMMVATFVTLIMAYGGVIPSYFTLLIILFVSAALARIIYGLFKGGSGESAI